MRKLNQKNWIAFFALTAILFFNFSAAVAQKNGDKEKMKHHKKERFEKMKTELNLSTDQVAKIEAINKEAHEKMKAVKEKHTSAKDAMKVEMKTIRQEKKSKIEAVLSPEQREKMAKIEEDFKKEHKGKHRKNNGK